MSNGANHVFAASDRPTVIYFSNKKLLYSNLNENEVQTSMASAPHPPAALPETLLRLEVLLAVPASCAGELHDKLQQRQLPKQPGHCHGELHDHRYH